MKRKSETMLIKFYKLAKKLSDANLLAKVDGLLVVRSKRCPTPIIFCTEDLDDFVQKYLNYEGQGKQIFNEDIAYLKPGTTIGRDVGRIFNKKKIPFRTEEEQSNESSDEEPFLTK